MGNPLIYVENADRSAGHRVATVNADSALELIVDALLPFYDRVIVEPRKEGWSDWASLQSWEGEGHPPPYPSGALFYEGTTTSSGGESPSPQPENPSLT